MNYEPSNAGAVYGTDAELTPNISPIPILVIKVLVFTHEP